jgi:hypothetical protein
MAPSFERLYSQEAETAVRTALVRWKPSVIIIDDSSVAGYIRAAREILPSSRVILRSHNVMHDVRNSQLSRTKGAKRIPVRYDCEKYLAFEAWAVKSCDEHWAISRADAKRMTALYHTPCQHLDVSVPLSNYEAIAVTSGRPNGFVHVGTLDFRRRSELALFLRVDWPQILDSDPSSTLTLAGKLYGREIVAPRVRYLGQVDDDAAVYREGRFALNFQSSTGGVKLKTLTSLAAGRTLLSTEQGVEGLNLVPGTHYLDLASFASAKQTKTLLNNPDDTAAIALAGRTYVRENHSRSAVAQHAKVLLESYPGQPPQLCLTNFSSQTPAPQP